jgi:hypothetical protein
VSTVALPQICVFKRVFFSKFGHVLNHIRQWTKNDVTKYINAYFEQKNDFLMSLFDLIDLVGLLLHWTL